MLLMPHIQVSLRLAFAPFEQLRRLRKSTIARVRRLLQQLQKRSASLCVLLLLIPRSMLLRRLWQQRQSAAKPTLLLQTPRGHMRRMRGAEAGAANCQKGRKAPEMTLHRLLRLHTRRRARRRVWPPPSRCEAPIAHRADVFALMLRAAAVFVDRVSLS